MSLAINTISSTGADQRPLHLAHPLCLLRERRLLSPVWPLRLLRPVWPLWPRRPLLLVSALVMLSGALSCSHREAAPPTIAPRVVSIEPEPEPEPVIDIAQLRSDADRHYGLGMEAQKAGDSELANAEFDAAIEVFMQSEFSSAQEQEFREAFNELVNRVHAQQLDDFQVPIEARAPELQQEPIPALSPGEIAMLRTRMADTLPAMPRFTIPVPAEHPRVLEALEYLTTSRREFIQEGLSRSTRYQPLIQEVFAAAGLPTELSWIPLIESLFKPYVRSRASAVGLWQLMAPTARLYGLRVDWYVDERRDPIKSTDAIARFIRDYYREFGDWHLTIAAYNGGKGRVAKAMRRSGADDFWTLASTRRYLPRETREFVPKILAAILIGTDPGAYGLQFEDQGVFRYEEVTIDSMTDLEVIAEAAGTDLATIQDLNPQLLRRTTPNSGAYTLRVPEGTAVAFGVAYAAIPVNERVRIVEHRIRNGETLSTIAGKYGISVAAISDLNGIRNRHRIRAGHTLLIPAGQASARRTSTTVSRDVVQGQGHARGEKLVHTVKNGESLWLIARAYDTTIADIKRWNSLTSDRLDRGDKLEIHYDTRDQVQDPAPAAAQAVAKAKVPSTPGVATPVANAASAPGVATPATDATPAPVANIISTPRPLPASSDPTPLQYTVARGDTLYDIARLYGVTSRDIKRWNNLRTSRIYPGKRLAIYTRAGGGGPTSSYTIRRGDTLSGIAQRFGVSVNEICGWNAISPRTTLYPGNRLVIRTADAGSGGR